MDHETLLPVEQVVRQVLFGVLYCLVYGQGVTIWGYILDLIPVLIRDCGFTG